MGLDHNDVPLELTELLAAAEADRVKRGQEYIHINICTSNGHALSQREVRQLLNLILKSGAHLLPNHAAVMITQIDLIRQMKAI